MKRILFLTVCLFIIATTAFAQQRGGGGGAFGGTPEENAKRTTDRMTTELKLTAAQVPQVSAINLSMAKERAQLVEKAGGDFTSVRADMQKLTEKTEAALSKVLTKEQLDLYKQQQATQRQRAGGGGGGGNR